MRVKKKILLLIAIVVIFILIFFGIGIKANGRFFDKLLQSEEEQSESDNELLKKLGSENVTIEETNNEEILANEKATNELQEDEKEPENIIKPLTDESVIPSDIYAENGSEVLFQCFDKEAESYDWEFYDMENKEWVSAKEENILSKEDEMHRKISVMKIQAASEYHEQMFRCIIHYPNREDSIHTASLFILKDRITKISAEDLTVNANTYLDTMKVPVKVTYQDGSEELIIGLNGLYFMVTEENTTYSTSVSGNRVETITMTSTECNYNKIGLEEKELQLRYHPSNREEAIETVIKVSGKDLYAPIISTVNISPYKISNVDRAVTLTISIAAEDEETPYPYLEYAFALSGEVLSEGDWKRKASFDIDIMKNGTYIAYVRDQAGNIAEMEQEIITVDTKAPIISEVSLSNENGWCKSNTIMVDAKDSGDISYRFICKADGTDSDWITYCEYTAETNGTWIIQAKDTAGNLSEEEIIISNIDQKAPIIRSITIKE